MILVRSLRPTSSSLSGLVRTAGQSAPRLTKRSFAYPKEGVFQSPNPPTPGTQQQQVYNTPLTPPPTQPILQYGAPIPPPTPPPTSSRWRPTKTTLAIALISTTIGILSVRSAFSEFILDVPSEAQAAADLAHAMQTLDSLELVQNLRNAWKTVDGQKVPVWKEYTAYQALKNPERRAERLTTGPLGTSHGVAAQKIFVTETATLHFVWFGNGTTGWPRIVHGGALATIMDESFGRFAARQVKERTAVTAYLKTNYLEKCEPGQWYVILVGLDAAHEGDQTEKKKYLSGFLACCEGNGPKLNGDVIEDVHPHVVGNALFVVPKKQTPPIPDEF